MCIIQSTILVVVLIAIVLYMLTLVSPSLYPLSFIIIVDTNHAIENRTRKSCAYIFAVVFGGGVDWDMDQQNCVTLHYIDIKTGSPFITVNLGLYPQETLTFLDV